MVWWQIDTWLKVGLLVECRGLKFCNFVKICFVLNLILMIWLHHYVEHVTRAQLPQDTIIFMIKKKSLPVYLERQLLCISKWPLIISLFSSYEIIYSCVPIPDLVQHSCKHLVQHSCKLQTWLQLFLKSISFTKGNVCVNLISGCQGNGLRIW